MKLLLIHTGGTIGMAPGPDGLHPAPGLVETPLLRAFAPDDLQRRIGRLPTGQPVQPEDIAQAVAFLADPRTRFITGQILLVDGGQSF